MKKLYWFILIISLMNIILSAAAYGKSQSHQSNMCALQCDAVLSSSYSKVLGFPVALLGVISFTLLALVLWYILVFKSPAAEKILLAFLIAGFIFAIRFLYLQAFVLNAFCPYCVVIDTSTVLAGSLYFYSESRKYRSKIARFARLANCTKSSKINAICYYMKWRK